MHAGWLASAESRSKTQVSLRRLTRGERSDLPEAGSLEAKRLASRVRRGNHKEEEDEDEMEERRKGGGFSGRTLKLTNLHL